METPTIWSISKAVWSISKKEGDIFVKTGFEELCLGHLPQLGLKPASKGQEAKNGIGFTFVPDPQIGKGYLWTYPINSTCSLTVYDVVFFRTCLFVIITRRHLRLLLVPRAVRSLCSKERAVIPKILWAIFWMKVFFHILSKREYQYEVLDLD